MGDDWNDGQYAAFMDELASFVVRTKAIPTLVGATTAEIDAVATMIGQPLPACYRAFLATFGHSDTWAWFDGDRASIADLPVARAVAEEVAEEDQQPWLRDPLVFPFTHHGGYVVYCLRLDAGDDPPVQVWKAGDDESPTAPRVHAPAFSAWLREQALLHVERPRWDQGYRTDRTTHPTDVLTAAYAEIHALRRQVIAEVHAADVVRGAIMGPLAFQVIWVRRLRQTDLYTRMVADGMYIPFWWARF